MVKTTKEITIRMATIDDIPQLLPLMEQLGYPQNAQDFQKRFGVFMNEVGYGVSVAEQDEKIVGLVAWSKSISFVSSKTRIHIEGLVVDEHYRGQSIGKKLMIFVEKFAKKFSPCIIDLTSGARRAKDGSHEFYKVLGYQNEGYMEKLYLRKEV